MVPESRGLREEASKLMMLEEGLRLSKMLISLFLIQYLVG